MKGMIYCTEAHGLYADDLTHYICIDKTLHIRKECSVGYRLYVLGPCDGSCMQSVELGLETNVEAAVRRFLANGDFSSRVIDEEDFHKGEPIK